MMVLFWRCRWLVLAVVAVRWGLVLGLVCAAENAATQVASERRAEHFEADGVTFRSDFPSAQVSEYARLDADEFQLTIRPENAPINNSAWYAFQVVADQPKTILVRLTYENGTHRYHPKISRDGRHWSLLEDGAIQRTKDRRQAVLRLEVDPQPLWVAAQELIGRQALESWMDRLAALPFATRSVIGRSIDDRPIYLVQITDSDDPGHVVIIGRQHPPEVTGTLGLMAFVDRLVEEDEMIVEFRRAFQLHVVGLVNPDGVDRGFWRHNLNGVDLNRDWGPFRQPETRAVRDHVLPLHQPAESRIYLWLDFHSTHQDIFYTQPDEAETFPPEFTRKWLEALDRRTPGYSVRRSSSLSDRPTSQQWSYKTFGAPGITYEFGDNTDRDQIRQVARIAAEEMVRLLVPARRAAEVAVP
jgi:cytosolic carboxypeptidase protein 6